MISPFGNYTAALALAACLLVVSASDLVANSGLVAKEISTKKSEENVVVLPGGQNLRADSLSVQQLLGWRKWGPGYVGQFRNRAVQISEDPHSQGIMIISPEPYGTELVITFDVMTLTPASVVVFLLSASDGDASGRLNLPEDFDGSMPAWPETAEHYFFGFHNAPHFRHPFVNRKARDGNTLLMEADRNYMSPGKWHNVEIGRSAGRIWMKVDGLQILYVTDPAPLGDGHLAFRARGSGTERASYFLKDVVIYQP